MTSQTLTSDKLDEARQSTVVSALSDTVGEERWYILVFPPVWGHCCNNEYI